VLNVSDSDLDQLVRELKASKGLEDLLYLNQQFLNNHDKLQREMHGELCRLCTDSWDNMLILMPRGTYKSSVLPRGTPSSRY